MFAPPPIIDTEVFTRLPEGFRMRDRSSQWADGQPGGFGKHSLLEGPCFDRHGNLYVVDIPYGRIFRVNPEGGWTLVVEYDGEPNGLKFHRDGRGFVADYKNGVMQLDAVNGHVRPYLTRHKLEHFKALAAKAMRQVLIDRVRKKAAVKHGAGLERVTLSLALEEGRHEACDVEALDAALTQLESLDARQARIVELRYFAGLSVVEVARELQVSTSTVEKEWRRARAWLGAQLKVG